MTKLLTPRKWKFTIYSLSSLRQLMRNLALTSTMTRHSIWIATWQSRFWQRMKRKSVIQRECISLCRMIFHFRPRTCRKNSSLGSDFASCAPMMPIPTTANYIIATVKYTVMIFPAITSRWKKSAEYFLHSRNLTRATVKTINLANGNGTTTKWEPGSLLMPKW